MKYIYFILLISFVATISLVFVYSKKSIIDDDVALKINDRYVSKAEFEKEYSARPYHIQSQDELIEGIITRELLIQEALKEKIDLDEDFRRSIKVYYEQSLTKVLLERKSNSFRTEASPLETERFLKLADTDITIIFYTAKNAASDPRQTIAKEMKGPFLGFSSHIQMTLLTVAVGEISPPVTINQETYRLKIDAISPGKENGEVSFTPEEAAAYIKEYRKEKALQEWLANLRKQAEIINNLAQ